MNVALVFPESTFLIDPMVYPPLGLWYLAAHLELLGHKTEFFDSSVDKLPEDGEFDQLWMSATSPQIHVVRKYGNLFKDWRKTTTVIGGSGPWAREIEYEDLGFDLVVAGEADQTDTIAGIFDLASKLRASHAGDSVYLGTQTSRIPKLAPIRRWANKYTAYLEDRNGVKHRTSTLFTSRGCPMACAFCESGRNGVIWDRIVRYEPISLVAEQLDQIQAIGFTGAMFYDDILPLNKARMLALLKELKDRNFAWRCFIRTDIIEKQGGFDYLRQMAGAGLVEVLAGVESANNEIKNNVHKGTTIEQDTQVLEWCKQLGIKFKASFILGLPGESKESMQRTKDWILTHRPDRADVNVLIPFPGTPIVDHSSEYDVYWSDTFPEEYWYKGPRDHSGHAVVGTSHLRPEEIKDFRDELNLEMTKENIPY